MAESRNTTSQPRNCQDLIQQGTTHEGHYVVYSDDTTPSRASIIYCSEDDGFIPLPRDTNKDLPRNCLDHQHNGMTANGIMVIYPYAEHPDTPVLVLCDQETDGGGWTVMQHRYDGSENFYRPWVEYSEGFGNPANEHYLGNDLISALTAQDVNELWVDLEDFDGVTAYAHYQAFHVDVSSRYYRLSVFNYNGTAGDALEYH
ncbi:unnamed protein product, partial [Meganyctiphanes norvegica]